MRPDCITWLRLHLAEPAHLIIEKLEAMCSVWPEPQPDRKLRWVTSVCTGPHLNCLQMGGSPQVSIRPHLWSDQGTRHFPAT